jgi:hypothetical protein
MQLGKGNRPFDTSFHRDELHRTNMILDGVKGCDELLKILGWHLMPLLREQPD